MPFQSKYEHHCYGTPVEGTDEVQTLTLGGAPTGGTFQLGFGGKTTAAISWTDVDSTLIAAIDAALEALSNIGAGDVTVAAGTLSSGIGTITITFGADLGKLSLPLITIEDDSLEGSAPTIAVEETTPGVTATARNAAAADLLESDSGNVYINMGAAKAPVWLPLE